MKERFNSLSILKKKKFNSLRHFEKNKGFNSLTHIEKRLQLFESSWKSSKKEVQFYESFHKIILKEFHSLSLFFLTHGSNVQFFESCSRNFNSLSHVQKGSIFWVIQEKKVQFFESFFWKSSIFLSFQKESHIQKMGSILWVVFKQKWVRFFESYSKKRKVPRSKKNTSLSYIQRRFNSLSQLKKNNSNWEEVHKRGSNSMSRLQRVQSFESLLKKKKVQFFESFFLTGSIISVSQIFFRKNSTLWVIFFSDFISLSHTKQTFLWVKRFGLILWVNFSKKKFFVIIQERSIKSGSHQNKSNSLNQVWKTKSSSLWVKSNSLSSFSKKELQFFKSLKKQVTF